VKLGRLIGSIFAIVLVFVVGVVGYSIIEGWSTADAAYMTIITLATVGFSEVHPLSEAGRVFTIVLIVAGVTALAASFGTFVDFLLEGYLRRFVEGRRMERQLAGLSGHHVIAGIGRVGSEVATAYAEMGATFVVVEEDPDRVAAAQAAGWTVIAGDASEEDVLRSAGIERARSLVTALDTDAANLFVTLTGRTLSADLFIVARSSHRSSEEKLRRAGADRVITPNVIGGRRMATMVLHPVVSDYLDVVTTGDGIEFRLDEFEVTKGWPYAGVSISEARLRDTVGVLVLAIHCADGSMNTNPSSETMMEVGDRLVVLGTADQLTKLEGKSVGA
jgi:voltage-gated potassium channel